jgi:hypothetical protein
VNIPQIDDIILNSSFMEAGSANPDKSLQLFGELIHDLDPDQLAQGANDGRN